MFQVLYAWNERLKFDHLLKPVGNAKQDAITARSKGNALHLFKTSTYRATEVVTIMRQTNLVGSDRRNCWRDIGGQREATVEVVPAVTAGRVDVGVKGSIRIISGVRWTSY